MGPNFDFKTWCDSWLLSSGVNLLQPVIEYNDDQTIKSFAIKQSFDNVGKNRMRQFKLDLAFYDQNFKPTIVKDVVISDKEALNPVELHIDKPIYAVNIDHGDHAYSKVVFDKRTLKTLEESLYKFDDITTRS